MVIIFGRSPFINEDKLIFPKESIKRAKNHLETVATKYLKIYQLNPNSYLNLPKIKMEDLL